MSGSTPWPRQKREIEAYNRFLSAYHSRDSYHGFSQRGYFLTNYFPTIDNRFTENRIEPDFALYDDKTLLLAEVKHGTNINTRDVKQAEKLDSVTIDAAEEYINKVDVQERFGLSGDVYSVEPLIYYDGLDSEYVHRCRNEWDECREMLNQIEETCPILGCEGQRRLQLMAGEFDSLELTEWLTYGIQMAETPRVTVTMTDGLEIESIAVTLCNIWGQRAVSEPISIEVSQVRQHFNYRELEPGRVQSAFEMLDDIGACSREGKREIEFTPEHMPTILNIERHMSGRRGAGQHDVTDF